MFAHRVVDECHSRGGIERGVVIGDLDHAAADQVVFDASSKADVLRINPACTHEFKRGQLVSETKLAESTVMGGRVDFTRGS